MPAHKLIRTVLVVLFVLLQLQGFAGAHQHLFQNGQQPAGKTESTPLLPADSNPQHDQLLADAPDILEVEAAYTHCCWPEIIFSAPANAELTTRIPHLFYSPLLQPPLHGIALLY
ncbi:MAG: hypothetical protein ACK4E8_07385 [Lacibacter sp.]